MRCKVCGAYNEDYLEYCENCAAPLEPDAAPIEQVSAGSAGAIEQGEPSSWGFVRSPSWPKPDFDANTVSEQDVPETYLDRFNPRPAGVESAKAEQTVEKVSPVREPRQEAQSRFHASDPSPALRAAPVCGPVSDEEPAEPVPPIRHKAEPKPRKAESVDYGYAGKSRRKQRKSSLPFFVAAGALVVVIVVFVIALLTNGFGGLFSSSNITDQATITEDTTDPNNKYYKITVYAKNGSSLRLTLGDRVVDSSENPNMIVETGKTTIKVPEVIFLPTEPVDAPTVEIYPDIVVIGKDGVTEEKVEFLTPIVIQLPTIELALTSPTSPLEVSSPDVAIAGTVSDTTAKVFVGEQQLIVDETGSFSGSYALSAEGASTISVEARRAGYQIARKTIEITYTPSAANTGTGTGTGSTPNTQTSAELTGSPAFSFADGFANLSANGSSADYAKRRTQQSTLTVTGTVQSGASLSVSGAELSSPVTINTAQGTFSFTVNMPEIRLYVVTVTSDLNGTAGTRTLYLERSHADSAAYMESTHVLDYQYITDSPHHKQGYKMIGKVVEVLQTAPFTIAKITTDQGDLLFYYYSGIATVKANDGLTYAVYADPNGRDDASGLPIMYAWYIKKS